MRSLLFSTLITVISSGTPPVKEGAVAISPIDTNVMIAAAIGGPGAPNADVHVFRSIDGGRTWSALGPLQKELAGNTVAGHWDPVLVFDRQGRAYLAVVAGFSFERWTIAVYRSDDNGLTWTGSAASSPSISRNDKPWIAIDDRGALHLAWYQLHSGQNGMAYAFSRDRGLTFSAPRLLPAFGWPYVAAGPEQRVYLSYPAQYGSWDVMRSMDGGETFSAPSRLADIESNFPHQIVAHGDNVYAVIPSTDAVYFTRSTDRGATWGSLKKLSGAAGGMMPSLDVDRSTGVVVLAWLEKVDSTRSRLYATRSTDGGATLEQPRAVSEPFNASHPVGEYNQLAAVNGVHVVVFADKDGVFRAARLDDGTAPPPPAPSSRRRRAVRP